MYICGTCVCMVWLRKLSSGLPAKKRNSDLKLQAGGLLRFGGQGNRRMEFPTIRATLFGGPYKDPPFRVL